jgi:hypothetical protein
MSRELCKQLELTLQHGAKDRDSSLGLAVIRYRYPKYFLDGFCNLELYWSVLSVCNLCEVLRIYSRSQPSTPDPEYSRSGILSLRVKYVSSFGKE